VESAEFESSLIFELNRVLMQAADEVESEERLDLAYEVLETVRFEQAHISWLDRLRNTDSTVELRLAHTHFPCAAGDITHLADQFMILENATTQFLINFDFVIAVTGLNELSQNQLSPSVPNWLDNVWFHDLCERRISATWYLVGDQIVEGFCRRIGIDSLDIETNNKVVTIPKRAIVANRSSKFS